MNKNSKNVLKYILELLIVAFGVFLGIYLSNLNDEIKRKEKRKESISMVIKEIEENMKELSKSIEYRENVKQQTDSLTKELSQNDFYKLYISDSKLSFNNVKGWDGLIMPHFSNTAFETAKLNGSVKDFDFGLIRRLNILYNQQNLIKETGGIILGKLTNINSSTQNYDILFIFSLMNNDLLNNEKKLMKEYNNFLEETKSNQIYID